MQQNVDLAQAAAASSAFLSQSLREEIQLSPPLLRKLSWLASRTKNLSKSFDFELFDSYNFAANVSGHIQYVESRSCRMAMKFQNTHISHNAHDTFIKAVWIYQYRRILSWPTVYPKPIFFSKYTIQIPQATKRSNTIKEESVSGDIFLYIEY